MGNKRFYDAVRDLIRDVHEPPEQPSTTRRRLSISYLLAAPQTCIVCWDQVPITQFTFSCNQCLGAFCSDCLQRYAKSASLDRNLLPLRCADQNCRASIPLSTLNGLLTQEEISKLIEFQCEMFRNSNDTSNIYNDQQEDITMEDCNIEETRHIDHDQALYQLMETMGWRRCPDCGTLVERTTGCPHIVCVCGGEFCYLCGERWVGRGAGCPNRCGWPTQEGFLGLLPERFEELREEVWQRIALLLHSLREHLERDRIETLAPPRINLDVNTPVVEMMNESQPTVQISSNVNSNVDNRPDKMRLRSLVHPSQENRL